MRTTKPFFRTCLFAFILLLSACSGGYEYKKSISDFPNKAWKRSRALSFQPDIQDTGAVRNVFLTFRHVYGFGTPKLELSTKIIAPSGKSAQKEHTFQMIEKGKKGKEPRYLSDCSGDICDRTLTLFKKLSFEEKGTYTFKIRQTGPKELLNVMEVGLKLRKKAEGEDVVIQKKALEK